MELGSTNKNAGGLGGTVGGKEGDLCFDMRLARRWKRRGIGCGNFGINVCSDMALKKTMIWRNGNNDAKSDLVDESYQEFLEYLMDGQHFDSDAGEAEEAAEYGLPRKRHIPEAANAKPQFSHGAKSDLVDESYLEFLKSFKDGEHCDSVIEEEGEAEDHVFPAENGTSRIRKIPEAANAKPQFSHWEKSDLVDEIYLEFLKSLTDGEHCDSVIEAEEEAEDHVSPAENGTSRLRHIPEASNSAKHQSNHGAKSHLADESYLEFLKYVKDGQHLEYAPEGGKRVIYEESDSDSEARWEAEDLVSSKNGCSSKSQSPEATNSAKHWCNRGVMSELEDESYQEFVKFVKNGQHLEYTPEGGEKVAYEDGDSDSEVMILDNNPFSDGKPTPVFVDLDGEDCNENHSGSKESVFRAGLMEIFRRPYNLLEFEKLWQDASYKSPLQGVRVLRKRDKSYALPSNGKSYLEAYSDLASVINHVQPDKLRILNLLRGFFYWLQNVAHEGSFKPWLDTSCLSALVPLKASTSGEYHKSICAMGTIQL